MTGVGRNDPCPCLAGPAVARAGQPHAAPGREAKSARPKLILLLKGMEVMAERDRRAGRPAYDVTRMWAELGLERPG